MSVEYIVTPDYFRTLGLELKRGRLITEQDRAGTPLVAVIDESFAQKYFSNEDPIGKHLEAGSGLKDVEIVGIVGHVKHYGLDGEVPVDPQYYLAFRQIPDELVAPVFRTVSLSVRASGDPAQLIGAIRQQVLSTDKDQPVFNARTMEQVIAESIASRRFAMLLLSIFACVALLLASVGIYGVMSYSVTQRTHEIGIRMALGASTRDVMKMIVGHGMGLTLLGVGCGLVAAILLSRFLSSLLFGVSAADPLTYGGVSLLLILVALVACYIPARRATRVDPMVALRYE
jgi:putative ABC transport system permease protein